MNVTKSISSYISPKRYWRNRQICPTQYIYFDNLSLYIIKMRRQATLFCVYLVRVSRPRKKSPQRSHTFSSDFWLLFSSIVLPLVFGETASVESTLGNSYTYGTRVQEREREREKVIGAGLKCQRRYWTNKRGGGPRVPFSVARGLILIIV